MGFIPGKNYLKTHWESILMLIVFGLMFLAVLYSAFAATIFTDDFNAYSTGDLNGQGSWTGNAEWDVIDTDCLEDKCAYISSTGEKYIAKTGASKILDGNLLWYIKQTETNKETIFWIKESDVDNRAVVMLNADGYIKYYTGSGWTSLGITYPSDTWFYIKLVWRDSDDKFQIYVDGDLALDWTYFWGLGGGIDKIDMGVSSAGTHTWIDYIGETPFGEEEPTSTISSSTSFITNANSYPFIFFSFIMLFTGGMYFIKKI